MIIVTNGVIIISTLVFPEINLPISAAITTAIKAPNGSPEPLIINLPWSSKLLVPKLDPNAPKNPTTPEAKITNLGALSACATPIPITGPVNAIAILAITSKKLDKLPLKFIAICLIINPIIRVQNSPNAIPFKATIKYLWNNLDRTLFLFIQYSPYLVNIILH